MSAKLKLCPFCGGEPTMETHVVPRNFMARIYCPTCEAEKVALDQDNSVTAQQLATTEWNTRVSNACVDDLIDALQSLLAFVDAHTANNEVIPPHTVEHVRARAAIAKAVQP